MFFRSDKLKYVRSCLFVQIFLFLLIIGLSQSHFASQFFYFDYIGEDEGLLNGSIEDIAQDQDGYIWFATQAGIYKYDGLSSSAYLRDGKAGSLLDGDIFDLLISSDNTLWAGTNGAGLARLDRETNTFTHISSDTGQTRIANFRVRKLAEYNNLILVLTDLGIEALNPDSLQTERYLLENKEGEQILDYYPYDIVFYRGGILTVVENELFFMSAGEKVFRRYNFPDYRHYAYSEKSKHFSVFLGGNGNIYLHTADGLFAANQQEKTIKREPFTPRGHDEERISIRNILVDRHNTHWLITRNHGLFYRLSNSKSYQKVDVGNGRNQLNTDLILSLFLDIDKNIWVGTDGLYAAKTRVPQDLFPFYSNYHQIDVDLHTHSAWSFAEWNGKTYVATHQGLFELQKGNDPVLKPILTGAKFHFAYDIDVVDDELWIATRQGLYRYQKNGVVTNISQEIFQRNPETVNLKAEFSQVEATEDYVLLGTYQGLIVLDKKAQTTEWFHIQGEGKYKIKDNWAWMLRYDPHNQWLWLGTTSGVDVIPLGTDSADVTQAKKELEAIKDSIHDVFIGERGEAWMATSLGLYRFTTEQQLLEYKHFAENNIRAIQIRNGQVWLSTANGLIQTSLEDTNSFNFYVREDGIYNVMNAEGSSYYSEQEDIIYFGGNRGVLEVKSNEPLQVEPVRKPVLEQVILLNQAPYPNIKADLVNGELLAATDNSLRFHFAYLDYKAPQRIRFQYKLEGFDNDWSEITNLNAVPYTNLQSGDYQFYLRAYNANNLVSEDVLAIEFTIMNPWWRSKLAYLVYALLVSGLAFLLMNYIRHQDERQRQVQLQRKKQEFISSYSEYSVLLASLSSYQSMARHFLDRVLLVTGAKYAALEQLVLEEDLLIEVGDKSATKFANKINKTLFLNQKESHLSLRDVSEPEVADLSSDINLLYQQMILAQDNLIERTKYKWSEYHDARTGLYTSHRFFRILREELTRAEVKKYAQSMLFWQVDANDFMQNNLIERIHLMKYGELVKESLGKHVVASYLEQDVVQQWLDSEQGSGFVVYLADSSQALVSEFDRKIRELVRIYKTQQPSLSNSADLQIIQINDVRKMKILCEVLVAKESTE